MQKNIIIIALLWGLHSFCAFSQESKGVKPEIKDSSVVNLSTFESTHLIIGQSIENVGKGKWNFLVSSHFGNISKGSTTFWGMDEATFRLGLEYGLTDRLEIGLGRSAYQKTIDGYVKYKLKRQSKKHPVSVSYFGSIAVNTMPWEDSSRKNYFSSRLSFVNQLIIARKMSEQVSLELIPTHVHRNLVKRVVDENEVFSVGAGGRCKVSEKLSLNAEYYYLIPGQTASDYNNAISVGVTLKGASSVFQLFLTNAIAPIEKGFIAETKGDWNTETLYLGFNFTKTFGACK